MQVLLPLKRVELQLIKMNEPQNQPPLTKPKEGTIATSNKNAVAKHEGSEEKVDKLERSHAAEPHAEPKKSVDKDEKLDEKLTKDLPSLFDRVKELN